MSRSIHELKTAKFEDGTHAVLRADPAKPRHLVVIATFFEAAHAQAYVQRHSAPTEQRHEEKRPGVRPAAKRKRRQAAAVKSQPATKTERKMPPKVNPKLAAKAATKRSAAVRPKSAIASKPKSPAAPMSDRQTAVLKALRSLKDKTNRVEVPVARIAKESSGRSGRFTRFWYPSRRSA